MKKKPTRRLTKKAVMGRPRISKDVLVNCTVQMPPSMIKSIDALCVSEEYSSRSEAFREVWAARLIEAGFQPVW